MVRLSEGTDMGVERQLLIGVSLQNEDFVCRIGRRQLEGFYSPFKHSLHFGCGAERLAMLSVVEDRHLNLSAPVAVEVVPVPNLTLGELPVVLNRFIAILGENEDFLFHLSTRATSGGDDFKDFSYRGLLAHLDKLWIHAIIGMNEYFDVFHDFTYVCMLARRQRDWRATLAIQRICHAPRSLSSSSDICIENA
jgi:hypothetical protein